MYTGRRKHARQDILGRQIWVLCMVHSKSTECGEIGTEKSLSVKNERDEGCRYWLHVDGLGNRRCSRLKLEYEGTGLLCIYAGLMQVLMSCHVLCRANANNRHLGVLSWPMIFWRHVSVEHIRNCIKLPNAAIPTFEAVNCTYSAK